MLRASGVDSFPAQHDGSAPIAGRWSASEPFLGENMARKLLNRKELREEGDAAERKAAEEKTAKKTPVKKKAKRKSRVKTPKEVRLKAFWGVFNQSLRRVAVFEHGERKQAEKKAKDLSESQKTPHFVQLVKEVIEE